MKNMKIMAVLAVLLAATLCMGAVSAAAVSDENFANLTANVSTLTATTEIPTPDILIYNQSAWVASANYEVYIDWGDGTTPLEEATLAAAVGTGSYNITVSHNYSTAGSYAVTLYNASSITATTASKRIATITVVDAKTIAAGEDAFVYE